MRKDSNLLLANQLKMMQTNIQIFTSEIFGNIRTCQVNNQIMFVGKDVATALGYSNTSKAIQQHVDHEDKGILPIRETAYETRAVENYQPRRSLIGQIPSLVAQSDC